jgi:hypothetical protein
VRHLIDVDSAPLPLLAATVTRFIFIFVEARRGLLLLVLEVGLGRLLFPAEPLAGHLLRDFTARFSRLPQKVVACRLINFENFIIFAADFRGLNLLDEHLVGPLLHLEPHLQLCVLVYNFLHIKV